MESLLNNKKTIMKFTLPALIIYTLVVIIPIIWSAVYSFVDWNGIGEMRFVGFDNYIEMLTNDRNFWPVVLNTLIYTVLQLLIQVGGGLLMAIFLTNIRRGRSLLQTLYYAPVVLSSVAICQIFGKFLSVSPQGLMNSILGLINPAWGQIEFLTNPNLSLYTAAFVEGYKYAGLYMIIFYAALIGVPSELEEAAKIDGANVFRQYINVKLPYIKPVILTNCILVINGSLRSFDISYLLTGGGPGNSSELVASYMYKQAFSSMKYGYGSAIAIFIVVECLIIAMLFKKNLMQFEE